MPAPAVQPGHEEIQADLAHCHQGGVALAGGELLLQLVQVGRYRLVHIQWMDAQRVAPAGRAGMVAGQVAHGVEVAHPHSGQHEPCHAGRLRPRGHLGAVCVEFGSIEVTVCVDPHDRLGTCRAPGAACAVPGFCGTAPAPPAPWKRAGTASCDEPQAL